MSFEITPLYFFNRINLAFGPIGVDVAATRENRKCERWIDSEMDGLKVDWRYQFLPEFRSLLERSNWFRYNAAWCNPVHDGSLDKWINKAISIADSGMKVIMVIPSYGYFYDRLLKRAYLFSINGRVPWENLAGESNRSGDQCIAIIPPSVPGVRHYFPEEFSGEINAE